MARPQLIRREVQPLEPTQVLGVAEKIAARLELTVWLGATAGPRKGEALGLAVEHVDSLRRRIRVEQQLQTHGGIAPVIVPPKTASSRRVIPMDQGLLDRIAAYLAT